MEAETSDMIFNHKYHKEHIDFEAVVFFATQFKLQQTLDFHCASLVIPAPESRPSRFFAFLAAQLVI